MENKKASNSPNHGGKNRERDETKKLSPQVTVVIDDDPSKCVEIVGVCFRPAGKIYYFSPAGKRLEIGTDVIVETSRGIEMGKIAIPNKTVSVGEIVSPLKEIMRVATPDDIAKGEENRRQEKAAKGIFEKKVADHGLEMKLVDVEYTFDNNKLLFYFTSEGRVDFRELVKDLAAVFKTRIELRQIGIRDEAKLIGGFGVCGRPFCCTGFLSDFTQVSIKMAKEQNFSLNSSKISGNCGRLMCCLKFEHETYEGLLKKLPPVGSYVSTPVGNGVVTEVQTLAERVRVKLDDKPEEQKVFDFSEITVLKRGKSRSKNDSDGAAGEAETIEND